MFKKYQHIERFGTSEVEGIEFGKCYIFPKIDGTNSSVWLEDGLLKAGSRKRELELDNDNQGFYNYICEHEGVRKLLVQNPELRLFGEWLVPHSLKTYKEDAWRKFYVFDVCRDNGDELEYLPYDEYVELLETYNIDYIPPICILKNGSYEQLVGQLKQNVFLIEDGKGVGEGIVIKRYDFVNRYGRTTWAKIVTSEFKAKHCKTMGAPEKEGKRMIESLIAEKYVTQALCDKEYAKIVSECDGWQSRYIPRLLNTVYYSVVNEEAWNFVKENKNPTINFKTLLHFVQTRVKELKTELF